MRQESPWWRKNEMDKRWKQSRCSQSDVHRVATPAARICQKTVGRILRHARWSNTLLRIWMERFLIDSKLFSDTGSSYRSFVQMVLPNELFRDSCSWKAPRGFYPSERKRHFPSARSFNNETVREFWTVEISAFKTETVTWHFISPWPVLSACPLTQVALLGPVRPCTVKKISILPWTAGQGRKSCRADIVSLSPASWSKVVPRSIFFLQTNSFLILSYANTYFIIHQSMPVKQNIISKK